MSEILDYTIMPEGTPVIELVALEGEPTTPPTEPRELSGVESAILIGVGVIAVGVLAWLNENKGSIYPKHPTNRPNNTDNQR